MSSRFKVQINPKILSWGRTSLGLNLQQAAQALDIGEDELRELESGSKDPSWGKLKKIAKVYKRPTATFFLTSIPVVQNLPQDFRTNAHAHESISPEANVEFRKVIRCRENAIELAKALEEDIPSLNFKLSLRTDPEEAGALIRNTLGVSDEIQRSLISEHAALNYWRNSVEKLGILVFQVSVNPKRDFRGASLIGEEFPTILISTKDSVYGRTFSILHEMCHILLRNGAICDMESGGRGKQYDEVEIFCNAVAGAALVPASILLNEPEVSKATAKTTWNELQLKKIANRYRVSAEVILRRLLTLGKCTKDNYEKFRAEILNRPVKVEKSSGGPERYRVVLARNSRLYSRLVLDGYAAKEITLADASDYLGSKIDHFAKIQKVIRGSEDE